MLNSILPISLTDSAQGPSLKPRLSQFPAESSTRNLVLLAQSGDDDAFSDLYSQFKSASS